MTDRLVPTAVVGSYAVPRWLDRLRTVRFEQRSGAEAVDSIHDVVVKAAVKDQEVARIDIVTDGEIRRDNMVDHFAARLAGVALDHRRQANYYDYADACAVGPLLREPMGLVEEFAFLRDITDRRVKFTVTGPHMLVKRITDDYYRDEREFSLAIAAVLNAELKRLVDAGAQFIQIDEPGFSAFPEDLKWGIEAINAMVEGVDARIGLHVCYGNRYGRPSWEGTYRFLFPAILEARIDELLLEFARKGTDDLVLFREFAGNLTLGMGVIDVKDDHVEEPEIVAERLRKGLEVVAPDRLVAAPDCGLRHLAPEVALRKLRALSAGAEIVRAEL